LSDWQLFVADRLQSVHGTARSSNVLSALWNDSRLQVFVGGNARIYHDKGFAGRRRCLDAQFAYHPIVKLMKIQKYNY
jgi:hypothetical protein